MHSRARTRIFSVLQATAVAAAGSAAAAAAAAASAAMDDGDDDAAAAAGARAAPAWIERDTVYECTGSPLSSNIDAIIGVLLDETTHALCKAKALGKGYALADVVTCIVELVVDLALPAAAFAPLMVALADINIEHRRARRLN
mgnify:CR=1 FL=1